MRISEGALGEGDAPQGRCCLHKELSLGEMKQCVHESVVDLLL